MAARSAGMIVTNPTTRKFGFPQTLIANHGERDYAGRAFVDAGRPGPPALASHIALGEDETVQLAADFTARWPG